VPENIRDVAVRLGGERGLPGFRLSLLVIVGILLASYGVELFFRAATRKARIELMEKDIPRMKGLLRFWAADLRILPWLVDIIVFVFTAFVFFIFVPGFDRPEMRMLFLALLAPLAVIRFCSVLSYLVNAPTVSSLRLLPVSDSTALFLHRLTLLFISYITYFIMFLALMGQMGMPYEAKVLSQIIAGTILIIALALVVLAKRKAVTDAILSGIEADPASSWVRTRFASSWHILALAYLFIVWLVGTGQIISGTMKSGSFLLSLLAVPLFLVLNRLGKWVVRTVIDTLRIYDINEALERLDVPAENGEGESRESLAQRLIREKNGAIRRANRFMSLVIVIAIACWLLDLWGHEIPYASGLIRAVFESLVTIMLGLIAWRFFSGYIEGKIRESLPQEEENSKEQDEEWGGAALRGRSYTLLPMVRKFIGSVLVVMVTLIILSAIGVNIGPLLAGAGVIGIAIGFGAQKLVSDILSGFFYLLDDAFRVGEYLQAGSVSGTVEAITLRNVMLRHHRGMLQIVPYSDLGSITNFMRGGIVVKFNLEFPYDTDIDKVRKIIKKVGKAMLEDEELGKDFIRPLKSQGVREITNSMMVIRVKFTAKPGAHFVIRREAYRRITEALMAKGILYAHRKVIVELPEESEAGSADRKKIAEAGAAAGLEAMAGDETKNTKQENS
jgi:small-conductance mechanosensitive channel